MGKGGDCIFPQNNGEDAAADTALARQACPVALSPFKGGPMFMELDTTKEGQIIKAQNAFDQLSFFMV